jgi:lipopolysaccharide/colanic/teichoic acid biosynthesis glycosyltransferase
MFQPSGTTIEQMMHHSGGLTLPPLSFAGPPAPRFVGWPHITKRLQDAVFAALLLLASVVPMLIAALLIRLESPGPVLFRQRRVGLDGSSFMIWKLRTMRVEPGQVEPGQVAPGRVEPGRVERGRMEPRRMESGRAEPAPTQPTAHNALCQARRGDPRITRVGAWLRCRSLDELPQLVNVLRGEMSLVGPRPHAPGTCAGGRPFELVSPHYAARHRVRPGMTGLAQVRGWRGETETEDKLLRRVDSDLEYIETWSLWLDLVILARTVTAVLHTRNAY